MKPKKRWEKRRSMALRTLLVREEIEEKFLSYANRGGSKTENGASSCSLSFGRDFGGFDEAVVD